MNVSINKQGVLSGTPIEPFLQLPDGSKWKLILFHFVDNGNNLFTQANANYCNDWGLFSRLEYADNFKYNNQYEFYAVQDGLQYRWLQNSAPSAASIQGPMAVSGYTCPQYGLAKANQSNSYFGYNSWWGAAGCWTRYTENGKIGIPGIKGVCEKYLAIYARVENFNAFIERDAVNANSFIEY